MLLTVLQIVAGALALIGMVALITGAMSKSETTRATCLRIMQVGMSLAGLVLMFTAFLGKTYEPAAGGLMLIIFGTAVTGFGRKPAKSAPQDES